MTSLLMGIFKTDVLNTAVGFEINVVDQGVFVFRIVYFSWIVGIHIIQKLS